MLIVELNSIIKRKTAYKRNVFQNQSRFLEITDI